jgi:hypothetical protein
VRRVVPLLLVAGVAHAHFAPDPETNNRYVKATLGAGEVRVVYVVYYGEKPGAVLRAAMDADHDGAISPAEAHAFGETVLGAVAPLVHIVVDGERIKPHHWRVADVGLGAAGSGAFSVDLEATIPYPDPQRATHTLAIDDGAQLDRAGEAELDIIESSGVRITSPGETYFTWKGNPSAGNHAVSVEFTVDPAIRPQRAQRPLHWPLILATLAILAGLALAGGAVAFFTRRR